MREKIFAVLLVAVLLLPTAAAAAELPVVTETAAATHTYRITLSGLPSGAAPYSLLVLKAGASPASLAAPEILYAAYAAAVEGTVTFSNVRLKCWRSADVYISGGALAQPICLPNGITAIGTVLAGTAVGNSSKADGGAVDSTNARGVTAQIYDAQNTLKQTISPGPTGAFAFDALPGGDYTVVLKKAGHLSMQRSVKLTLGGEQTLENAILLGGDVDGDGQITPSDFALMVQTMSSFADILQNGTASADLDGNHWVEVVDMSLLQRNFLQRSNMSEVFP